MKKNNWIIIGVILLLISALAIIGQTTGLLSVGSVAEGDVTASPGGFIGVPAYGTLSCEPSKEGNVNLPSTGFEEFGDKTFFCESQLNLVDGCSLNLQLPDKEDHQGTTDAFFKYVICDFNSATCSLDAPTSQTFRLRTLGIAVDSNDGRVLSPITLNNNQYVIAQVQTFSLLGRLTIGDGAGYYYTARPYKIYRYDTFSENNLKELSGSLDCSIDNNRVERNYLIEDVRGGGDLEDDLEVSDYLDLNNLRQKGATVSYLTNIVGVVPQYQFFDDDTKYCYDRKIYAVEEVETPGGVYKIANTFSNRILQSVECCNNLEVRPGYACEDFKEVAVSEVTTCSVFKPCPYTEGVATADKKYITQYCESGECINDIVTVACNFPSDCASGYCDVDPFNPQNNKCVTLKPLEECGNGRCQAELGENSLTCPSDCGSPDDKDYTTIIILASLVLLAIMLIGLRINKGKSSRGGPIKL